MATVLNPNPVMLDSPQPVYNIPPLATIPDGPEDKPIPGKPMDVVGSMTFPEIVLGGASISAQYNTDVHLNSDMPLRTVRLALRYGIRAIDTSPYYGMSEIILGSVLRALAPEFPRQSYRLMTKVGRYGPLKEDFDYSPQSIRRSVMRSLQRLNSTYLDVVFLHDVEFIASPVWPIPYCGDFERVLNDKEGRADWGLLPGKEGKAWGAGDETILAAVRELFKMKSEGLIRAIGISGYPLPTLLRIARLVLHSEPFQPVDVVMSYSHSTLQNSRFEQYLPHFLSLGRVSQVLTASPFSMGLLTPNPPHWHPAPPDLLQAAKFAQTASTDWPGGIANLALGYSLRRPKVNGENSPFNDVPTVVGVSNLNEVHEAIRVWREVSAVGVSVIRISQEDMVKGIFHAAGWLNWSWSSPPNFAFDMQAFDNMGRRVRMDKTRLMAPAPPTT